MSDNHQIWLTGASGFLGSRILEVLARREFEVVTAISRRPAVSNSRFVKWEHPSFTPTLCKSDKVSIIHAATDYGWSPEPEKSTIEANLILPLGLIRKAGENLDSLVVLDSFYNKIDRHYPHLRQYSRSKRMLIQWLREDWPKFHVSRVFLEHLYGPLDSRKKFVPWLLSELIAGRDLPLTRGEQVRDFTFVDDAAAAIVEILNQTISRREAFLEFEVGRGQATSIHELALLAKQVLGSSSKLLMGELPDREGEIAASVAQSPSSQGLNWSPKIGLEEGLMLTSQWLREEQQG